MTRRERPAQEDERNKTENVFKNKNHPKGGFCFVLT